MVHMSGCVVKIFFYYKHVHTYINRFLREFIHTDMFIHFPFMVDVEGQKMRASMLCIAFSYLQTEREKEKEMH